MSTERKIRGVVYRCDQLPAEQGFDMLMRVTGFFAAHPDAIGSIMGGQSADEGPAAMLALAMAGADGAEAKSMMIALVETCRVNGEKCIVGVKPADLTSFVAVAWFAMEVQFKDFLSAGVTSKVG